MTIRKLKSDNSDKIQFDLKKSEAVIVYVVDNVTNCIYLQIDDTSELLKLTTIENVQQYKFVGCKQLWSQVRPLIRHWNNPENIIVLNDRLGIQYFPQTQKIKYEKNPTKCESIKKVLIVDDSKTIRNLLASIIEKDDSFIIAGKAESAEHAQTFIESMKIDLITLDIHMPKMNGVEFYKSYIKQKDIPTVMISSVSINEGPLVVDALTSGAVTYIQKPSVNELDSVSPVILEKLRAASRSIGHRKKVGQLKLTDQFKDTNGLILIGSSTGGTQALQKLFTKLPANIPPIVVVQHIPAVFSKALADRLNDLCSFRVKEVEDEEYLESNTVYIAPGGPQCKLVKRGGRLKLTLVDDAKMSGFSPSVDYLFLKSSKIIRENTLGIILTGMGSDGAKGLLSLKNAGATTIAQDEESSVVFGMPKEAINLGGAMHVHSLDDMHVEMINVYNSRTKRKKTA